MVRVTNQKPVEITPFYTEDISQPIDTNGMIDEMISQKLFTPQINGTNVRLNNNGMDLNNDDITNMVNSCMTDPVDVNTETALKDLLSKTLVYFDGKTPLSIQELFLTQAAKATNLPYPAPGHIIYTPGADIIPTCKEFLAGKCGQYQLLASFGFYARPKTLGVYFANNIAFEKFIKWFKITNQNIQGNLNANTTKMLSQFENIKFKDLTESLRIRTTFSQNLDPYCFARILTQRIIEYTTIASSADYGILPFNLKELILPNTIVFINIDKHARSCESKIVKEWELINKSIQLPINVISTYSISKLTDSIRHANQAIEQAAQFSGSKFDLGKSKQLPFRKTAPTTVDLTRTVTKILSKMGNMARSQNAIKETRMSFMKASRREPDNFNKQGRDISTKYKPDIHIYLDTSGSISQQNYESAVKACILLAKKLNVNLYFNSFSHVMSQCVQLKTHDRSLSDIYKKFQSVPKVTGGTDFEQIWKYINNSPKRKKELSLLITDFAYCVSHEYTEHPRNLYYFPCSNMNYNAIKCNAEYFCNSAKHIDPNLRSHLIF